MIFVGGFSYFANKTYSDVLRLRLVKYPHRDTGRLPTWEWDTLPNFPWPIQSAGVVAMGSIVYVMGGGQYDGKLFCTWQNCDMFETWTGEDRIGARLLMLDTSRPDGTWIERAPCPGTPRWVHATVAHDDHIYVFGGASGTDKHAPGNAAGQVMNVVDNWKWNSHTDVWEPLPYLPAASGNFPGGQVVFKDRYVILVGGNPYGKVVDTNGNTYEPYGEEHVHHLCDDPAEENFVKLSCPTNCSLVSNGQILGHEYYADIFVFDLRTHRFGTVTASSPKDPDLLPLGCGVMPQNNNLPLAAVSPYGSQLIMVGGECDKRVVINSKVDLTFYGHYTRLALVGNLTVHVRESVATGAARVPAEKRS